MPNPGQIRAGLLYFDWRGSSSGIALPCQPPEVWRMPGLIEREGYGFIPGPFQYSAGVVARPGHRIERVRFMRPVPLAGGFAAVEAFLASEALPLTAFCACELRSPAPFTDAGFIAFNRLYVGTLARWGIVRGEENPVARSNVCPEIDPPPAPSFHAFSFVRPAGGGPQSFVVAGSGEAQEGAGPYRDKTVRFGETGADAIGEKLRFVVAQMERRMAAMAVSWAGATATQVYSVHDFHAALGPDLVARGAAPAGIDWHFCRPPVIGLEYEMDCRGVYHEHVLPA